MLRAGLGMLAAAQALLPESRCGFIGVARDEHTHRADEYLVSLPEDLRGTRCWCWTRCWPPAGRWSMRCAGWPSGCHQRDRGVRGVRAAGLAAAEAAMPGLRLITAVVDDGLNPDAFIVPGLGDAGDRQFGPR